MIVQFQIEITDKTMENLTPRRCGVNKLSKAQRVRFQCLSLSMSALSISYHSDSVIFCSVSVFIFVRHLFGNKVVEYRC